MSKRRKIFERQEIDYESGEIKFEYSKYVSNDNETFFMGRTTEGLEWILEFKNLTECQLLMLMVELENIKNNHIINFTGLQVKECAKILKVSEIQIKKCLASLTKKNFLKRVFRGNYLANPTCFYKGGSLNLKNRIHFYNSYDTNKRELDENNI